MEALFNSQASPANHMKTPLHQECHSCHTTLKGFTLIELLVILTCLALLASTLVAALAKGSAKSYALVCLHNQRQLIIAWQKYANDHNGALVHAFHGGQAQHGAAANNPKYQPWALGWLADW